MPLVERFLRQMLVYWPPAGIGGNAQPTFGTAVELKCRWSEAHEEIVVQRGDATLNVTCNSVVVTLENLEEQGVCWLARGVSPDDPEGTALAALTDAANPFAQTHAFQIQKTAENWSVDGRDSVKKAYL